MKRRLFNLLAGGSLALCVISTVLWVKPHYFRVDNANFRFQLDAQGIFMEVDSEEIHGRAASSDINWEYAGFHYRDREFYRRARELTVPFWFVSATTLLSTALCIWMAPKQFGVGRCPRCGYDLRATPDRCPECGTTPESMS